MHDAQTTPPMEYRPEGWTDDLPALARLVGRLDDAVECGEFDAICRAIETALSGAIDAGDTLIPDGFGRVAHGHYARRLLHPDPDGRYTVICMTWGAGQGTPLHDHGDSWGSVGVYRGRIRVTPYEVEREGPEDGLWEFSAGAPVEASPGAAASVVPPTDHHVIENPFDDTAISIHVYRGRMETCGVYLPTDTPGTYRREQKTLVFDGA